LAYENTWFRSREGEVVMEAASAIRLPVQMRLRRFERECERLRPLGEAYVMRRFGGSLSRADAEDAVSEVVIRLHRRMMDGRAPQNLRAAFFTSVRNAAIDQLRSRSARPTVALEAAADAPTDRAIPVESAEEREDGVRLQEALARMRDNYREAIVLRFGLGLTVPEISRHLGISLPAAKKLVLRASRQVRKRLESIEDAEFCPEMRELAQQSLFEKHASGLASEAEAEILRAHFAHCGSCRSFLASLHDGLHELGSAALLGLTAAGGASRSGLLGQLASWAEGAANAASTSVEKARHAAFKAAGVLQSGDGAAGGALVGTGQKIVAVCTAGAAATATCVATGIVGPGIATPLTPGPGHHDSHPVQARQASAPSTAAPVAQPEVAPPPQQSTAHSSRSGTSSAGAQPHTGKRASTKPQATSSSQQPAQQGEFGFEGSPAPAPPPRSTATPSVSLSSAAARSPTTSAPSTGGGGSSGGGSSGGGSSGGGSSGGGSSGGGSSGGGSGGGGETFGFGG
jgi:RNA polymerase sigma factor (sigma-70 family)